MVSLSVYFTSRDKIVSRPKMYYAKNRAYIASIKNKNYNIYLLLTQEIYMFLRCNIFIDAIKLYVYTDESDRIYH